MMMNKALCLSCMYQGCIYQKDSDRPVWQCEEYGGYKNPSEKNARKNNPSSAQKQISLNDDLERYKGLCVTCAYRETCTYPKPEGGVWHCEEYM